MDHTNLHSWWANPVAEETQHRNTSFPEQKKNSRSLTERMQRMFKLINWILSFLAWLRLRQALGTLFVEISPISCRFFRLKVSSFNDRYLSCLSKRSGRLVFFVHKHRPSKCQKETRLQQSWEQQICQMFPEITFFCKSFHVLIIFSNVFFPYHSVTFPSRFRQLRCWCHSRQLGGAVLLIWR